ncbi:nucleotide-diphospho-sugar transferase [Pedobacter kyonggii]|uniref:nucleotide-diphospho-sugar transferase n=1 Tax=Pedobacter kyonggii TaxID=1926871 RepID=UPI001ABF9845|nr:nucleotide-diphospho-sugar transferase [Pedobacter kyonggii]
MLHTPILLLIFNRPEQALLIFGQIRLQQPERLFIAADGPRADQPGEAALCETTRTTILNGIDWPCKIETLFRPDNLGCGKAVSTAIDWFFNNVEEGIILEDDCLPDPTFFSFCTVMLEKYRLNKNIMHVNGGNYQAGMLRGNGSYYFSRYAHVWGWASWRRAWQHYDFSLKCYKNDSRQGLNSFLQSELQSVNNAQTDTWDIQWFMSVWFNKGLVITPNISLVKNIGYGKNATHTHSVPQWFNKIQYGKIVDIKHPDNNNINEEADRYSLKTLYSPGRFYTAIKKIAQNNMWLFNQCKRIYRMVN